MAVRETGGRATRHEVAHRAQRGEREELGVEGAVGGLTNTAFGRSAFTYADQHGVALTLVFLGGALGKLTCAWVARRLGIVATIVVAQTLTAAGSVAVLALPLSAALMLLPVLGIALNGVTTVIYGSVPSYAPPERRTHALSVFYTVTIGSAALAPPLSGLLGDLVGIPTAIITIALLTLATIPLAFGLVRGPSALRAT